MLTISVVTVVPSFDDITEKVQYEGDKLDKSDLEKLYITIFSLGKFLKVSQDILDKIQIKIIKGTYEFAAENNCIIINELAALILLEKQNFENYLTENDYDHQIFQAMANKNIRFMKQNFHCSPFLSSCFFQKQPSGKFLYAHLLAVCISSDEIKAAIAHEFGHLEWNKQRREQTVEELTAFCTAAFLVVGFSWFVINLITFMSNDSVTRNQIIINILAIALFQTTKWVPLKLHVARRKEIYADKFVTQDLNLSKAAYSFHKRTQNVEDTLLALIPIPVRLKLRLLKKTSSHPTSQQRADFFQNAISIS